jgi:hypothetical protein
VVVAFLTYSVVRHGFVHVGNCLVRIGVANSKISWNLIFGYFVFFVMLAMNNGYKFIYSGRDSFSLVL